MTTSDPITSASNVRLKLVRKLAARNGREREGAFVVEGEDLVLAGVRAGWEPRFVLGNADERPREVVQEGIDVTWVPAEFIADVATLAHPPRVLAVFDLPRAERSAVASGPSIYLDGLGDPGNVGTVLRAAQAFGIGQALLGPETADPFSPKATRASMGAVFGVQCRSVRDLADVVADDAHVVVLDAAATTPLHEADLGAAPVLCIGSERTGVSRATRARANELVAIPQHDEIDSLNAAMAATLVMYEWQRQQLARGIALP